MRHEEHRRVAHARGSFSSIDALNVQVVGRLVEQEEVGPREQLAASARRLRWPPSADAGVRSSERTRSTSHSFFISLSAPARSSIASLARAGIAAAASSPPSSTSAAAAKLAQRREPAAQAVEELLGECAVGQRRVLLDVRQLHVLRKADVAGFGRGAGDTFSSELCRRRSRRGRPWPREAWAQCPGTGSWPSKVCARPLAESSTSPPSTRVARFACGWARMRVRHAYSAVRHAVADAAEIAASRAARRRRRRGVGDRVDMDEEIARDGDAGSTAHRLQALILRPALTTPRGWPAKAKPASTERARRLAVRLRQEARRDKASVCGEAATPGRC